MVQRIRAVPLALVVVSVGMMVSTCAKQQPATPTPTPGAGAKPRPPFIAEAAPEPIATPGIWFAFDPDFIRNHYQSADLAFGSLTISDEWRASGVHDESCSGEDGEVHVGVYDDHMGLNPSEMPFSSPIEVERIAWGSVIEPPNVTSAQAAELEAREGKTATLEGFFRVWNEGHYDDQTDRVAGGFSNPNHVLELHPAWRMTTPGPGAIKREYNLQPMSDYKGYGLSKLRPILNGFAAGKWPTIYQDSEELYIHLPKGQPYEANFFQVPVIIRSVTPLGEGIIMQADVCDNLGCSGTPLYKSLRLTTVPSTAEGKLYRANEQTEVLGIFSLNLRRALDLAPTSETEAGAKVLPQVLEFFVFGRAKNGAVRNSACLPEKME
jgi:hypothetical protein